MYVSCVNNNNYYYYSNVTTLLLKQTRKDIKNYIACE